MAFWTIIGKGKEGDTEGKHFGVTLNTDESTWVAGGPNVDLFFDTKSGPYSSVVVPENGTRLGNAAGEEVAFFKALTVASPVGATGTGRASEKGVNFDWTLDSK